MCIRDQFCASYSDSTKDQNRFVAFEKSPGSRRSFVAQDGKTALFEHADRGLVVCRHACMKRAAGHESQQELERTRRHTSAPILLPDPITDHVLTIRFEAVDVPGKMTVNQDSSGEDLGVVKNFAPMLVEGIQSPRHDSRHAIGFRIDFVTEQSRKIAFAKVPELD